MPAYQAGLVSWSRARARGRRTPRGPWSKPGLPATPLLHLTGQTASGYVDRGQGPVHDVPDQLGMLESVSKAAFRVRSAETAFGTLVQAATLALTPPTGPVSVEIPIDIQRENGRPAGGNSSTCPCRCHAPTPVRQPASMRSRRGSRNAHRPLLWTGKRGQARPCCGGTLAAARHPVGNELERPRRRAGRGSTGPRSPHDHARVSRVPALGRSVGGRRVSSPWTGNR